MKSELFFDGFESGTLSRWDAGSSSIAFDTSVPHSGTKCAYFPQASKVIWKTIETTGKLYFDFYVRVSSGTATKKIFNFTILPNYNEVSLLYSANGHWKRMNSGSVVNLPTDTTYTVDTWTHIEIVVDIPNSTIEWIVDGVSKGSATLKDDNGNTISTSAEIADFDFSQSSTGNPYYLDDVYVYKEMTGCPRQMMHMRRMRT